MRKILGIVSSLAVGWIAERQQRRSIYELERLDDRLLADIGLRRSEVESVIRHGLGRRSAQRRRDLIARSSWGIMRAERRFAARPLASPLLFALVLISMLLSAIVAAGAQAGAARHVPLIAVHDLSGME